MQKAPTITLVIIVVITVFLSVSLMQSMRSMDEYRAATKESLDKIERRMDKLDTNLDEAITSKQMSGHLIGVRTSLKEILIILNK